MTLRPPFFYGWLVIAVAMACFFLASGSSQIVMGVMLRPIVEETGWSQTVVTSAVTTGSILGGLMAPVFGLLADRYGPRVLMPAGALVVSVAFFGMSAATQLWQFFLAYVIARSVSTVCMAGVVPMTAATNWFRRRRGRAVGILTMAFPVGNTTWVTAGQFFLAGGSWRGLFLFLSAAIAIVGTIPPAVVMRRRPEDLGLQPDGFPVPAAGGGGPGGRPAVPPAPDFTLREAFRTPAFWFLLAGQVLGILAWGTVGFHQAPYYVDIGFPDAVGAAAVGAASIAGAVSGALWGFMSERVSERWLTVGVMIAAAVVLRLMFAPPGPEVAIVLAGLYGITARGEQSLLSLLLANYFGRGSYGAISGFMGPFIMVGLAVGPLLGSLVFEAAGTYHGLFGAIIGLHAATAVVVVLARRPVHRSVAASSAP